MGNIEHSNKSDHIRRNPQDAQGRIAGGHGDLVGDEGEQVENWKLLEAEEQGRTESRIGEAGNAQSAMLGGTGDLDRVHRRQNDTNEIKAAAEDDPDLINPRATATPDSGQP